VHLDAERSEDLHDLSDLCSRLAPLDVDQEANADAGGEREVWLGKAERAPRFPHEAP
jgi:hypothetical protein